MSSNVQAKAGKAGVIQLSRFAYSRLLAFYPRDLRSRFEAEMIDVFEQLLRDAVVREGWAGVVALWRSALYELLTVAAPSRLQNTALMAGALSFLVTSTLFFAFFSALKTVL